MKMHLNNDWFFSKVFFKELLNPTDEILNNLEKVRLPHNFCNLPFNYFDEKDYQLEAGYVHKLILDEKDKDKCFILNFLGAAHYAKIYINSIKVIENKCGYLAFKVDITKYLNFGKENIITVYLNSKESNNIPPFGNVIDYLTYGGLYREVYIDVLNKSHFNQIHLNAFMNKELSFKIDGENIDSSFKLQVKVLDKDNEIIFNSNEIQYNETFSFKINQAKLWSIEEPNLYKVEVNLIKNNEIIDTFIDRVGFRDISSRSDGIYLNNHKIKIRGLNRHQSYPYVGYAMPKRVQRLDADILKNELGVNAVRTSHYPQSHDFIDRCDELGLLVFMEIPGWQYIGNEEWINQSLENIKNMINQYYNHPSIFIWGVRINESPDNDSFYIKANALAKDLDSYRLTGGVRNFKKSHLFEDVYTYNDFIHSGSNVGCERKNKVTSNINKAYLITENNGHMFPTKSFDNESHRLDHALRHAKVLDDVMKYDDIAGSFAWCFFDYNTHKDFGSGDKICYHGVCDMFRNPKMAAYVYASQKEDEPFLKISSSMDIGEYPAGNLDKIYAFTNCDYVKLFKNDQYVKTYFKPSNSHLKHYPIEIDDRIGHLLEENEHMSSKDAKKVSECLLAIAKYGQYGIPLKYKLKIALLFLSGKFNLESGTKLYGKYIQSWGDKITSWRFEGFKDGKKVIEVLKNPSAMIKYDIKVDTTILNDDITYDVASIRINAMDQNNNPLPYLNRSLNLKVEGDIELISPNSISLMGGNTGLYIKSLRKGKGKLTILDDQMIIKEIDFIIK